MKLPRDVSGGELVRSLRRLGYEVVRQVGSHVQLAVTRGNRYKLTIPNHRALRVGTLDGIIDAVSQQLAMSRDEVTAAVLEG